MLGKIIDKQIIIKSIARAFLCDTKNEEIWSIMFSDALSSFLFSSKQAIKSFYSFRKEKNSDIYVTKKAYSFDTRYTKADYELNSQLKPL